MHAMSKLAWGYEPSTIQSYLQVAVGSKGHTSEAGHSWEGALVHSAISTPKKIFIYFTT